MLRALWHVHEEESFTNDLRTILGNLSLHPKLQTELLESTYFALSRNPHRSGSPVMNTPFRVIRWSPPFIEGHITIFYQIVGREVRLLGAQHRRS